MTWQAVVDAGGDLGRDLDRVDWSATPLGPPERWPDSLLSVLRVVVSSRFAMWMAWGPQLTFFCNDAYRRDTLGTKYPWALGRPASEVWGEIWDDVGPRIASVLGTGVSTWDESLRLFLERSGYREETYHTFSYSPLADESGATMGMLCVVAEETERVIAERRLRTLRDVAADLAEAADEDEVFQRLAATLGRDRADLPFTLTYLFDGDGDGDGDGEGQGTRLVASTGLAGGPQQELIEAAASGGPGWPLPEPGGGPLAVTADRFPAAVRRLLPELGAAAPGRAVVLPLRARPEVQPIGLLVAGITPFRPLDDGILSFVGLLTDQVDAALTTVRMLESARQRVEALAELDRVKSQFFANVSHELRTPLTLILGPLERIRGTVTTTLPALAPEVETMHGNALRLSKLVTDVLDFSRLQAGRLMPAREPVDLAVATRELAEMFRSAIEHAGLRYVVSCDDVGTVTIDASMWERIVLNLLSNALKFTFDGEICVRLSRQGTSVRLTVEDTGAGIPDHELPRLFERFHRVERSRARSSEGSGIGLALVSELVALHGGQVEADSELDVGSTFTVTLPLATLRAGTGPDPAADPQPVPPSGSTAGRSGSGIAPAAFLAEVARWTAGDERGAGAAAAAWAPALAVVPSVAEAESEGTILVVDDNADMRAYLARLLAPRFTVHTAVDGADALDQIQVRRPDLVVSDVMMPNVDGVELVRRIRSEPELADLPVILLTAAASTAATAEGFDVGADDYLVKPFTAENLLLRVTARIAAGHDRRRRLAVGDLRGALGAVATAEDVLGVVEAFLRGQLGVDISGLALVDERTGTVRLWHQPGLRAGLGERYRSGTTASPAPAFVAIRTSEPVIVADRSAMAARFPEVRADLAAAGIEAAAVLPLRTATGVVRGSLAAYWSGPRLLAGHEVDLLTDAAGVVAEAVDRIATAAQEHRFLVEFQERLLEIDHRSTEAVVAVRYQPARNSLVGGDWFDVITLPDGSVGITIGDVVGSGLPAATSMSQLRSAARLAAMAHPDPPEVLTMLDAFAARAPAAYCATALYARLQTDRVLRWSSAGHPPPLLVVGAEARFLDGGLQPLLGFGGHEKGSSGGDGARSAEVVLPPASTLLFYTDGMIERRGELIDDGLQRLAAEAVAQRHLGLSRLADALIAAITPEDGLRDDVALVALRTVGSRPELLVDAFRSDTAELASARSRFRHWLEDDGTPPGWVDDLVLAFGEVIANAVEHGNANNNRKVIGVEAARVHNRIEVSVTDAGTWLADSNSSQRRGRGRGFSIINAIADSVDVDPGRTGTTVTFTVDIPSVEPSSS
ncbi:MAG: SpoIIE family protein phosphatase [Acidimicrobiales bacterium]